MAGNVREYISPATDGMLGVTGPFGTSTIVSVMVAGPELWGVVSPTIGSSTWAANRLLFIPIILSSPFLVNQVFWINGTAVDSNTDIGVYDEAGTTRIMSCGSTVNAGTSTTQIVNVSDVYLPSNRRLWLALGCNSSVQTYRRASMSTQIGEWCGILGQAGGWSSGLPTSITPTTGISDTIPFFGLTGQSVI